MVSAETPPVVSNNLLKHVYLPKPPKHSERPKHFRATQLASLVSEESALGVEGLSSILAFDIRPRHTEDVIR